MIRYFKGRQSEFVIRYRKGKRVRAGVGLNFFYREEITSIVSVPVDTQDLSFVFREITSNFQDVTIQGQIAFRIADPLRAASAIDFEIVPWTRAYVTKSPSALPQRIVNLVQESTRAEIQRMSLEDTLRTGADLARSIAGRLRKSEDLAGLGVEVLEVFVTAVKPTPEVAKALEADYRELLLKKADSAIYARRASAVEQERTIRENELDTDIALEREREKLVGLKAANLEQEAAADAKALESRLSPYRSIDHRVLIALGFKAIGENSQKIGTLNLTPDLLSLLLKDAAA